MGPGDLSRALASLPRQTDARLLVGSESFDDAGVFVLSDDIALVQTVDFFAPIVDDPYDFGRIAAANALSDVYAMGGEPLTAMNIVGFPTSTLPVEVLTEILRGGYDMVRAAGAVMAGGHTVVDEELKYGLSVTGRAEPKRLLTNAGARVGDVLVLTKPLGSGLLTTAARSGELDADAHGTMVQWMARLNDVASRAALAVGARCATDITGFGLLGHASHIARGSGVTLRIDPARVPLLPGARAAAERGVSTGGGGRNAEYLESRVAWGDTDFVVRAILVDPQTSGGLLVAVPASAVDDYLSRVAEAVEIGAVVAREQVDIVLS
ncbi:MAG TPA: selenide, water dikinase SelD [Gemmatimonadaceae bacterium]|nr:selenide, water dikinase SelD [Gemmatimonadaceae bacterium]